MVIALIVAVSILAVCLSGALFVSFNRERRYQTIIADLLDRVMARSYGEYQATKILPATPAKKRRYLSDPELAEMERQARGEIAVLASEQGYK